VWLRVSEVLMRLLLLGPPGSGKGTQAERLAKLLDIPHLSSGELLRKEVEAGTDCGNAVSEALRTGELVPDEWVLDLLREPMVTASAGGGYLLDGFPRTLRQAEAAAEMAREEGVTADAAVFLVADPTALVERLLKRAEQSGRSDDNEQTIRHRTEVYNSKTAPLREYYAERGILHEIDALQDVDTVTADILRALGRNSDGSPVGAAAS
jgi:adenylate kinase